MSDKIGVVSAPTLPPGPQLPALLQTLAFGLEPVRFIEACRRRYGDIITFATVFDAPFVMVFAPELVKQLFQAAPESLCAGEANALLAPLLGDRSILLQDGDAHMRRRRILLPPFHGKRMLAYTEVIRRSADRAIDSWPVGRPFALLPSMQSLTLEVIIRAIFGVDDTALKQRVRAAVEPVSRRLGVLVMGLSRGRLQDRGAMRRFAARSRELDELIYGEIERRRRSAGSAKGEDVLSMLLRMRDSQGDPIPDLELRDQLVTLLVAGHETTATALAWSFELLLRNPAVLDRLLASLPDGDLYLDAVARETLRARPVIPAVGRVVHHEPLSIGGHLIPAGVEISPSITSIHRRADRFPEPLEFRPERFLESNPPNAYSRIPFGGGVRRCLGASFALLEMRVTIRAALERTVLQLVDAQPARAVRRGITLDPRRGVRVVQRERPEPRR